MLPLNEEKNEQKRKRALVMLIIAGALLLGALVWSVLLSKNGFTAGVARQLAEHGVNVRADELTQHSFKSGTSVRELLGEENAAKAAEASRLSGFPSDIERTGKVACLIAEADGGVLTVYVVDDDVELAFIQTVDGELLPAADGR